MDETNAINLRWHPPEPSAEAPLSPLMSQINAAAILLKLLDSSDHN
jgi:hypothetical protein